MPTVAEQWVEEGRIEGEKIGLQKGREEGRQEGEEIGLEKGRAAALSVLRRLLASRFGVSVDHFDAALQSLDLAAITALSEAAFEADSLADFETILATTTNPPE